jgi:hypothetical protein
VCPACKQLHCVHAPKPAQHKSRVHLSFNRRCLMPVLHTRPPTWCCQQLLQCPPASKQRLLLLAAGCCAQQHHCQHELLAAHLQPATQNSQQHHMKRQ